MSAAPKCANCGDSGRNPGSEYLDCTHCDAATQHAELGRFLVSHYADPACAWKVHQRAYAMGVAAMKSALANLSDKQLSDVVSKSKNVDQMAGMILPASFAREVLEAAMKVKP